VVLEDFLVQLEVEEELEVIVLLMQLMEILVVEQVQNQV
jgi:hypothetical protein